MANRRVFVDESRTPHALGVVAKGQGLTYDAVSISSHLVATDALLEWVRNDPNLVGINGKALANEVIWIPVETWDAHVDSAGKLI